MTLAELLEGLKVADPETYEEISHLEFVGWHQPRNQALDHLQGCIQRACERRGWPLVLSFDCDPDHQKTWVAKICDGWTLLGLSAGHASPAEALLAAYIAAVKGEKNDLKG